LLPNQTARGKFTNPYYKGDDYLRVANNSYALQKYLEENGVKFVMPAYDNSKDPYHMLPSWTKNFAKSYKDSFIAGDSNAVGLNMFGYNRNSTDGNKIPHPNSKANLSWGAQTSKTIANELEKHLNWLNEQKERPGKASGGLSFGNIATQDSEGETNPDGSPKTNASSPIVPIEASNSEGGGGGGQGGGPGNDASSAGSQAGGGGQRDSNNADSTGTTGGNAEKRGGRVSKMQESEHNVIKRALTLSNHGSPLSDAMRIARQHRGRP